MKKDFVMPILVLSLICLLMSGALAFGNNLTQPVIDKAAVERAEIARTEIIPDAEGFALIEEEGFPRSVMEAYATTNDVGYIFIVTTSGGYGGDFQIICGISPDGKVIQTKVLAHNETKGLGTKVFDWAYNEYPGVDRNLYGIDAIAGSTITSNAFKRGIRDAFEAYEIIKGARP